MSGTSYLPEIPIEPIETPQEKADREAKEAAAKKAAKEKVKAELFRRIPNSYARQLLLQADRLKQIREYVANLPEYIVYADNNTLLATEQFRSEDGTLTLKELTGLDIGNRAGNGLFWSEIFGVRGVNRANPWDTPLGGFKLNYFECKNVISRLNAWGNVVFKLTQADFDKAMGMLQSYLSTVDAKIQVYKDNATKLKQDLQTYSVEIPILQKQIGTSKRGVMEQGAMLFAIRAATLLVGDARDSLSEVVSSRGSEVTTVLRAYTETMFGVVPSFYLTLSEVIVAAKDPHYYYNWTMSRPGGTVAYATQNQAIWDETAKKTLDSYYASIKPYEQALTDALSAESVVRRASPIQDDTTESIIAPLPIGGDTLLSGRGENTSVDNVPKRGNRTIPLRKDNVPQKASRVLR